VSDTRTVYELRVLPDDRDAYVLRLYRARLEGSRNGSAPFEPVATLRGTQLRASLQHVLDALRRCGHRPSDLGLRRTRPFSVREEDAVRLGLLFLAVRPLRRLDRMEAIGERLEEMADEEAYYWFAKVTDARGGRRAQRALRLLLAEE